MKFLINKVLYQVSQDLLHSGKETLLSDNQFICLNMNIFKRFKSSYWSIVSLINLIVHAHPYTTCCPRCIAVLTRDGGPNVVRL